MFSVTPDAKRESPNVTVDDALALFQRYSNAKLGNASPETSSFVLNGEPKYLSIKTLRDPSAVRQLAGTFVPPDGEFSEPTSRFRSSGFQGHM